MAIALRRAPMLAHDPGQEACFRCRASDRDPDIAMVRYKLSRVDNFLESSLLT